MKHPNRYKVQQSAQHVKVDVLLISFIIKVGDTLHFFAFGFYSQIQVFMFVATRAS